MYLTFGGIITLVKEKQLSNAHGDILIKPLGILISSNETHPLNTMKSIDSTLSGMLIFFNDWQLKNANWLIEVTLLGIFISSNKSQLENAYSSCDNSNLKILLSHRPERTEYYEQYDFDLVLTGHAHAGQIRIPFINRGLWAPSQGFLPKYVSGPYELKNGSTMIVSRGLARESTPLPRFFNHPEIVVIDIE